MLRASGISYLTYLLTANYRNPHIKRKTPYIISLVVVVEPFFRGALLVF